MKFARVSILLLVLAGFPAWGQAPATGEAVLPGAQDVEREISEAVGAPEEAEATAGEPQEEMVYLNVQDQDIKDVIRQISKATSRNFIIDPKVSGKVTILSNRMMTKEEAYQAFLSALEVAGFTTVEGPGGILKIIPLREARNYPIPTHVDTTPFTDRYITRLITLENISANEMASAIKDLISRNGNLFAYPETNTLVLTDSGTNINRLMKIIKELDQEGPQEVVEIIPVHFASSKDISDIILKLYQEEQKAGRGQAGGADVLQLSKMIPDERTNSIIVKASKRVIDKVKELVNRLDAKLEEGAEGKIHVHYLKYAKAKDIASVLQSLAGQATKPGQAGDGVVIAQLEDFKVAADDGTNSLLITATAKTYNTLVDKVLSRLDVPRKQVFLEAMVLEFKLSRNKTFGISTHAGGGSGNFLGFGQSFKQLISLIDPLSSTGSNVFATGGLLGGLLSRRTVDVKVTDSAGAVKTITIPAFSAFIKALDTFGDTNLVASPNLLALDNEEAEIEIITKEPEPGQTTISATGLQQLGKPERIEAGLRLTLTPQITEQGNVRLDIKEEFSSFTTAKNTNLGTQAIRERKVKTSVMTSDGQTVVIGGLMEDEVTTDKAKIPVLGDIPILGLLFRQTTTGKSKSNLLLFITPHIIRDGADFEKVARRKIGQQQDFVKKNFKPKQQRTIHKTIEEHDPDLLRKQEPLTGADSRRAGVSQGSGLPPVITAPQEAGSKAVIILPSRGTSPAPAEINIDAEVQKREEASAPMVTPVPSPAETAVETEVETVELPPPPPPPAEALPPPQKSPPPPAASSRPPVIILPPGQGPDLSD